MSLWEKAKSLGKSAYKKLVGGGQKAANKQRKKKEHTVQRSTKSTGTSQHRGGSSARSNQNQQRARTVQKTTQRVTSAVSSRGTQSRTGAIGAASKGSVSNAPRTGSVKKRTSSGAIGIGSTSRSGAIGSLSKGSVNASKAKPNGRYEFKAPTRQDAKKAAEISKGIAATGGKKQTHELTYGSHLGEAISKATHGAIKTTTAAGQRLTNRSQAVSEAFKESAKVIAKYEKENGKLDEETKRRFMIDSAKDVNKEYTKSIKKDKKYNKAIEDYSQAVADNAVKKQEVRTLKATDLSMEDFLKYQNAQRMGNPKLGKKALGDKLSKEFGNMTAYSAGKNTISKVTTGVMQGLSVGDNIHGGLETYGKEAKDVIKQVQGSGAYNAGYAGGQMLGFVAGGTQKAAQSLATAGLKGGAKALAKAEARSAGKKFIRNRAAEIATESPMNILDAVKMARDENGNVNRKELAKYLALNTVLTGATGGAMEGIGTAVTRSQVKELGRLRDLKAAGRLDAKGAESLQKLEAKIAKAADDVASARSNVADEALGIKKLDRSDSNELIKLMKKRESTKLSEAEVKRYDELTKQADNLTKENAIVRADLQRSMQVKASTLNKLAKETGVEYEVADNSTIVKALKENGKKVEDDVFINGVAITTKDGKKKIYVNSESDQAHNVILGHETTHLLKGTESFNALRDSVKELAENLGEYDALRNEFKRIYESDMKGMTKEEAEDFLDEEVTAELTGRYLFGENAEKFVKNLSTKDRNAFQKVYDYIVDAIRKATGNAEKRQLQAIKENFDKAYREMGETPDSLRKNIDTEAKETESTMKWQADNVDEKYLDDVGAEVKYSKVTDKKTLDFLEEQEKNGEYVEVYRSLAKVNGQYYPPMASKVNGRFQDPIKFGEWDGSVERPDLLKKDKSGELMMSKDGYGYIPLTKSNGKGLDKVAYNPYNHTSPTMLNDQFSEAFRRPELVVVRCHVPKSELTSGYKAPYAKDAVGYLPWHSGTVTAQLPGTRNVILSRWVKPIEEVPPDEIARSIKGMFDDAGVKLEMPYNVVTPQVRRELENLGVTIKGSDDPHFSSEVPPLQKPLKEQQFDIIKESNPAPDDTHTWIRSVDDIKDYRNAIDEDDIFTNDYTKADAEEALATGKVTVYSSQKIENGAFVTPSKMEAQSYAGSGKVYKKQVNVQDVAWVDSLEGQYAKAKFSKSKKVDSTGAELSEGQQKYFEKSKMRDADGNLVKVYHSTDSGGFTKFDPAKSDDGRTLFFSDSKDVSKSYANMTDDFDPYSKPTKIKDVNELPSLDSMSEKELTDNISNIKITDKDGNIIASGDDIVSAAKDVARKLSNDGVDDYDDLINSATVGDAFDILGDAKNYDIDISMDYRGPHEATDASSTYSVYLNAENPLILNGEGRAWDDVPLGENESDFNQWLKDKGRDPQTSANTRTIAEYAQKKGYDGVIYRDIQDNGGVTNGPDSTSNIYAVFESNKVKDVRNQNPTESTDIRFSKKKKTNEPVEKDSAAVTKAKERYNATIEGLENGSVDGTVLRDAGIAKQGKVYRDIKTNAEIPTKEVRKWLEESRDYIIERRQRIEKHPDYAQFHEYDELEAKYNEMVESVAGEENPSTKIRNEIDSIAAKLESIENKYGGPDKFASAQEKALKNAMSDVEKELATGKPVEQMKAEASEIKTKIKNEEKLRKKADVSSRDVAEMSDADLAKESRKLFYGIKNGKTEEHIKLRKERQKQVEAEIRKRKEETPAYASLREDQLSDNDPGRSIKSDEDIAKEQARDESKPTQHVNKAALSEVAKEPPQIRQPQWMRSFRRLMVNSLAGFEDVAKKSGNNKLLTQINNVQHWTNRFASFIEGSRSGLDRKVSGKGLNQIFNDAKLFGKKNIERRNDFVNYLTYKHAIDRLKYDKPVHLDPATGASKYSEADYRSMMAEIERKYRAKGEDEFTTPKVLQDFNDDVRGFYDDIMKMREDAGLISKEFADELRDKYPNYIPTLREGDDWLENGSQKGSKQKFGIEDRIKTATGGSQGIMDLYQSTMRITRDVIRDSEQNMLMREYAETMGFPGAKTVKPESLSELPSFATHTTKTEKGWRISFFQDGQMVTMPCDKQIALGLREINGQDYARLMNLASKFSRPMRMFKAPITDYNVLFGVRNGARDIQQAAVNSKDLRRFTASIPTAQASVMRRNIPGGKPDPWMKSYEANGGLYTNFARQDTEYGMRYVEPGSEGAVKKGLDATAGKALRGLEAINSAIEATPRMAEYIGTITKDVDAQLRKKGSSLKKFKEDLKKELYGNKEMTDEQMERFSDIYAQRVLDMASTETIDNAARNAADITLNFSRNGVIGKALNMGFVPYFNPSVQGLSKTIRMFTETGAEGSRALLNFGMKLGVITMAPAMANEILCADNRDYQNLATREKDTNFFIPIGDGKFIKVPKPRENAVMAEPVTYGLRYLLEKASIGEIELPGGIGKDGVIMEGEYSQWKDLGQMWTSAKDNIAPVPLDENLFSPMLRLAQNKTWYGGSIESVGEVLGKKEGDLKNSEIYDNTTSAVAIQIGQTKIGGNAISDITHLSPKKIDDLMDSYLGVMYDLGISQTAEVTKGNPVVNQFVKDSVFSNKNGAELWAEFEHANSPKDLKGKLKAKAKEYVLGHSAANINEKTIEASDWLNQKGYDDMTYSSAIETLRQDKSFSEKQKQNIIRRWKRAQNEQRTNLVYGDKEVHWKKDPLRTIAEVVGVDKAMKEYTYTYENPETGEKTNQHLDAWNVYKKSAEYKGDKEKSGKKFLDFYSKMRWTNGRIGESKSFPGWMTASVIAATDSGKNDELAKAYIQPKSYEDGKSLNTEFQESIIQRGKNLKNVDYTQKEYRASQRSIFKTGRELQYEYTSKMNPWDKAMSLATDKKKYVDTNYYAADVSGKISRRMNYARCLDKKGYTSREIYDFAKKYDIKLPKTENMSYDQYRSTMSAFNAKVEAAVKKEYGDKPLEEQSAVYHVITDDYRNHPFGEIGDYGLKGDTGITDLDAKSGGGGWGYGRRRRRGYRRRGWGGGYGGHGGRGGASTPKTASGAITAANLTGIKSTDLKVTDYTVKSNIDEAYRKKMRKITENARKSPVKRKQ